MLLFSNLLPSLIVLVNNLSGVKRASLVGWCVTEFIRVLQREHAC